MAAVSAGRVARTSSSGSAMLDFPSPATNGQRFPDPAIAGLPVWEWDGTKWRPISTGTAIEDAPVDAVYGRSGDAWVQTPTYAPGPIVGTTPRQLWWNQSNDNLHLWIGSVWRSLGIDDGEF